MNVVLDSTIIIHLRHIGCSHILGAVSNRMGWKVYLPTKVRIEATRKEPLAEDIIEEIQNGNILEASPSKASFAVLKARHPNLGDGELDSISVVTECEDRTLRPYIILSDDAAARRQAERLGIECVGILPVLSLANRHGMLSKSKAIEYLERLQQNNFSPKQQYVDRFLRSLI